MRKKKKKKKREKFISLIFLVFFSTFSERFYLCLHAVLSGWGGDFSFFLLPSPLLARAAISLPLFFTSPPFFFSLSSSAAILAHAIHFVPLVSSVWPCSTPCSHAENGFTMILSSRFPQARFVGLHSPTAPTRLSRVFSILSASCHCHHCLVLATMHCRVAHMRLHVDLMRYRMNHTRCRVSFVPAIAQWDFWYLFFLYLFFFMYFAAPFVVVC